jgi:hypothetical protein
MSADLARPLRKTAIFTPSAQLIGSSYQGIKRKTAIFTPSAPRFC